MADYWAEDKRTYHHTAPISMVYALRESLRLIFEEGLEARYARHTLNSDALLAGLQELGFSLFSRVGHHLPTLICVYLPPLLDDRSIRSILLHEFNIEVGGGLGPLAGKVWRIGLMGESSRFEHVMTLLAALDQICAGLTHSHPQGKALAAANTVYTLSRRSL